MKEKNRKKKIIEIVALILAILALIIGGVAYFVSWNVKVEEEQKVKPNKEDFDIVFTPTVDDKEHPEEEVKEIVGVSSTGESVGEAKVVKTEEGTIANIQAKFTKPGQEVVYNFYSHNKGKYEAYLDTITYANVKNQNFFKVCYAMNPNTTNRYLVSSACEAISMEVKVGDNVITKGSVTGIKNHKLDKDDSEKVTITIRYAKNGTMVDGDFVVEFGPVTLTYLSKLEMESKK